MITHIEKVIFADIFNHTIKPTINPFWNHVEVLFGLGDNFIVYNLSTCRYESYFYYNNLT